MRLVQSTCRGQASIAQDLPGDRAAEDASSAETMIAVADLADEKVNTESCTRHGAHTLAQHLRFTQYFRQRSGLTSLYQIRINVTHSGLLTSRYPFSPCPAVQASDATN